MLAARLALEQSQSSKAAPLARQALAMARKTGSVAAQVRCQLLLARAALEYSASAEAKAALAEAKALMDKNLLPDLQLAHAALSARVAAVPQFAAAEKELETALVSIAPRASFDVQLDARIVAAQLQLRGCTSSAAVPLAAIEKEAAEHGFLLAARRARAAMPKRL